MGTWKIVSIFRPSYATTSLKYLPLYSTWWLPQNSLWFHTKCLLLNYHACTKPLNNQFWQYKGLPSLARNMGFYLNTFFGYWRLNMPSHLDTHCPAIMNYIEPISAKLPNCQNIDELKFVAASGGMTKVLQKMSLLMPLLTNMVLLISCDVELPFLRNYMAKCSWEAVSIQIPSNYLLLTRHVLGSKIPRMGMALNV